MVPATNWPPNGTNLVTCLAIIRLPKPWKVFLAILRVTTSPAKSTALSFSWLICAPLFKSTAASGCSIKPNLAEISGSNFDNSVASTATSSSGTGTTAAAADILALLLIIASHSRLIFSRSSFGSMVLVEFSADIIFPSKKFQLSIVKVVLQNACNKRWLFINGHWYCFINGKWGLFGLIITECKRMNKHLFAKKC